MRLLARILLVVIGPIVINNGITCSSRLKRRAYETHAAWQVTPEMVEDRSLLDYMGWCSLSQSSIAEKSTFRLYTRSNPTEYHSITSGDIKTLGFFNASQPTLLVIHGFLSSAQYLEESDDFLSNAVNYREGNVIFFDWGKIAENMFYPCTASNALEIGDYIADFIDWLNKDVGTNSSQFHLVGHSLGAHAVGRAGQLLAKSSGKLGRITGLDPAGPFFDVDDTNQVLDPSDANFVDVIHTSGCAILECCFGIPDAIGHVDFYPNGGRKQRECGEPSKFGGILCGDVCSHHAAISYFAESLVNKDWFRSFPCKDFGTYETGYCFKSNPNHMGVNADPNMTGEFFLTTRENTPLNGRQVLVGTTLMSEIKGKITFHILEEVITFISSDNSMHAHSNYSKVIAVESDLRANLSALYDGDQKEASFHYISLYDFRNNKRYHIDGPITLKSGEHYVMEID